MLSGLGLLTTLTVYHQFEQTNYYYSCFYCRLLYAKIHCAEDSKIPVSE